MNTISLTDLVKATPENVYGRKIPFILYEVVSTHTHGKNDHTLSFAQIKVNSYMHVPAHGTATINFTDELGLTGYGNLADYFIKI